MQRYCLMNRSAQREAVFKMIFSSQFLIDEELEDMYARLVETYECVDSEYVRKAFFGVAETKDELDALIEKCAKGWKLSRISKISLCAMRLSIYEMKYIDDVPFAASINEAVELVKKYDEEKTVKFANGVLNTAAVELGLK